MSAAVPDGARWTETADDPMDPAAIARRRAVIDRARRPPISDRVAFLRDAVAGRRLLDIGVVDHSLGSSRSDAWLHGRLSEVAGTSLGVDILADAVEELRSQGYDVLCLDVTTGGRPPGRFDVIVAGEVVEHLGDIGGLFEAAADLLDAGGCFILTTPNPYAAWRVYQNLRGRPAENVDHVTFLTAWGIAELAERVGLRLEAVHGIAPGQLVGRKARMLAWAVRRRLVPIVPEALAESLLYVVVPQGPARPGARPGDATAS